MDRLAVAINIIALFVAVWQLRVELQKRKSTKLPVAFSVKNSKNIQIKNARVKGMRFAEIDGTEGFVAEKVRLNMYPGSLLRVTFWSCLVVVLCALLVFFATKVANI
jgi:hypothetical protein